MCNSSPFAPMLRGGRKKPPTQIATLFALHGRPLVLKSDNGSAFHPEATNQWLLTASVAQLFSPAGYAQYGGQLERPNATNKMTRTSGAVSQDLRIHLLKLSSLKPPL